MGEIVFIGLGLNDELGISLRGLREVETADAVFIELYTNVLPDFSLKSFEQLSRKKTCLLSRKDLEERNGEALLTAAVAGKAVLLVPGEPLIATTHIALRMEAQRRGIRTRIVHAASIISAAISLSGLHNYKFGKSVTIPFPENLSETPYEVLTQNTELGLHTLCLLDIRTEEKRYLSINEALGVLLQSERKNKKAIVAADRVAIGIARAGSDTPIVKADPVRKLLNIDFGGPPQTLIFPGRLHFMEAEALIVFAGAPASLRDGTI